MTIKIITWIKSTRNQLDLDNSFDVEPFNYNGYNIIRVKVDSGSKNHYQKFMKNDLTQTWNRGYNRVQLELNENEIEGNPMLVYSGAYSLKLKGNVNIKQWNPSSSRFRVKVIEKKKWGQLTDHRVELEIENTERETLTPKTEKLEISFGSDLGKRDEIFNGIKKNTEYFIENVNWNNVAWTDSTDKKLNLNWHGNQQIPKLTDVNATQTQPTTNPDKVAAEAKVRGIINRADEIIRVISNHIKANSEDLKKAEQVIQELKNIKNNGNSEEKQQLASWDEDTYITGFENKINFLRSHLNLQNIPGSQNQNIPSSKIPTNSNEAEEYNNLYSKENNETARKYKELRGKIFDRKEDYDKYANVNSTLLNEINEKEGKLGVFWNIESGDKADYKKRAQQHNNGVSTRMKELVDLMEKLIAEESAKGNDKKRGREGDESLPEAKRSKSEEDEVKQNIAKSRHENREKSKEKDNKLTSLIREAQQKNNYEELESILKQIDELEGEQIYQDRQQDIQELKTKLANLDVNKFREKVKNDLESKLKSNNVDENNLSPEMKDKLAKIRKGEISDVNEVIAFEKEFSEKVGDESANNKLSSLITKAQSLIGKVRNGARVLKKELEEVLEEMIKFVSSTNVHEKKSYSEKAEEVNNMLVELKKTESSVLENQKGIAPWKIILPISVGVVVLAAIIMIVRNRRIKKARAKLIE